MTIKTISGYYSSIPLVIAVLSTLLFGLFVFPEIATEEYVEISFVLLATFLYYLIILSILFALFYRPVSIYFRKNSGEAFFLNRVHSLSALCGSSTFITTALWTWIFIFPNSMEGEGTHFVQYADMFILLSFTLVAFPSFLSYLLVTQVSSSLMNIAFQNTGILFNPKKSNLWIKLLLFVCIVSILPISYLFISTIHSDFVLNGIVAARNESIQVQHFYIALVAVMIIAVIIISTFTLFRQMKSSISRLMEVINKVQQGNLDVAVPVTSFDEVGQLTYNFNRMIGGLREREQLKDKLGTYVSSEIAEYIMQSKIFLEGEEREVTILFTDIAGYTSISECLSPKETVTMLNTYYNMLVEVVQNNHGVVNKFIGDSLMVLFNAPVDDPNHALNAIRCAREIITITENTEFEGGIKLSTRVGINSGTVIAGNLGSKNRHEYTVIGDPVNLAQRLEQLGKKFEKNILFSETTYKLIKDEFSGEYIGSVQVKGKNLPVKVYTV